MKDKQTTNKKEDTLRKRYAFKLSSNFFSGGISAIIQLMVPRGLGPEVYGNFGFMTAFFDNVMNSMDTGSSYWFFTKLSQKKEDKKIVNFYRLIMTVFIVLVLGFVIISTVIGFSNKIWIDQSNQIIYLAVVYSILFWVLHVQTKIMDAYGLTVNAGKTRIVQKIIGILIITILFFLNRLNLITLFAYHYFIIILLIILYTSIARRKGYPDTFVPRIDKKEGKQYFRDLYRYVYPLITYTIVGLVTVLVDRWLLQKFGGSIQQGYFTLSFKIGAIISLFTVSLTPLLMREFSVSFGKKDIKSIRAMFRKYLPVMYLITAYLSCFVAVQYDKVVLIIGGEEYRSAGVVVLIMAFYPIHQTYGQLTSTVYYATGQTKLYRNIGITGMILGLPMIYFLLAPKSMFGLESGALGLAIKMVILNIIIVNVWLYFNTRYLKLSFSKFLLHQFGSVAILFILALLSKYIVDFIPFLDDKAILSLILSAIIYTIVTVLISNYFPKILGMDRETLDKVKLRVIGKLRNVFTKIKRK